MSLQLLVALIAVGTILFALVLFAGGLLVALILSRMPVLPVPQIFSDSSEHPEPPDRRPGGYYAINHIGQGNS